MAPLGTPAVHTSTLRQELFYQFYVPHSPKNEDLGRQGFQSSRQKDAYAEETCIELTELETELFPL